MKSNILHYILLCSASLGATAQSAYKDEFNNFIQNTSVEYESLRQQCNEEYANFLELAWKRYESKDPIELPIEPAPLPPLPYTPPVVKPQDTPVTPLKIPSPPSPVIITPIKVTPQPKPIEPIKKENPQPIDNTFSFVFYGLNLYAHYPDNYRIRLPKCNESAVSQAWKKLSSTAMNNTLLDCLEMREKYHLCDWAYLQLLENLAKAYYGDSNEAVLLMAWLYCQSGYQMRFAMDRGELYMMYGSKHIIYQQRHFNVDGIWFYPYHCNSTSLNISDIKFKGETPMSLTINTCQNLGSAQSEARTINSKRYNDMTIQTTVNTDLIEFYNSYPSSEIGGNMMTRWAMYADTPLSTETRDILYPALTQLFNGKTPLQSVQMLLNWVQTGFVYEYDDKVWGHDRAFFAEETLYYPYCDCEDRSILFSRLVRDLLDLDVALIYYPGHLATAVCLDEEVNGDVIMIGDRKFIVCDPTYIGAPVGSQMPGLDYNAIKAIVLKR